MYRLARFFVAVGLLTATQGVEAQVPSPQDVFGWLPGADYEVADYEQMLAYFLQLDAASERVDLIEIGRSTMGRPTLWLFLPSEENIRELERWRSISERLARARRGENEARSLAAEGIAWIDSGMDDMEMAAASRWRRVPTGRAGGESAHQVLQRSTGLLAMHRDP